MCNPVNQMQLSTHRVSGTNGMIGSDRDSVVPFDGSSQSWWDLVVVSHDEIHTVLRTVTVVCSWTRYDAHKIWCLCDCGTLSSKLPTPTPWSLFLDDILSFLPLHHPENSNNLLTRLSHIRNQEVDWLRSSIAYPSNRSAFFHVPRAIGAYLSAHQDNQGFRMVQVLVFHRDQVQLLDQRVYVSTQQQNCWCGIIVCMSTVTVRNICSTHIHTHVNTHTHTLARARSHTEHDTHTCTHHTTRTCTCTQFTTTHTHVNTYTYARAYTENDTHTHTHTHRERMTHTHSLPSHTHTCQQTHTHTCTHRVHVNTHTLGIQKIIYLYCVWTIAFFSLNAFIFLSRLAIVFCFWSSVIGVDL